MGIIDSTRQLGGQGIGAAKPAVAEYDFSVDGGSTGDIALRGDSVPSGAVVVDALLQVDTAPTSGGSATVAVKVESAADVNDADAISGAPWSTTGPKRADFTATSTPVAATADRTPTITVGTADLTAGVFTVIVWYVEIS